MATAVRRKGVFVSILTAIIVVAMTVPFTVIHPVLPFTLVLMGYGCFGLMQRWRWLPKDRPSYLIGCLVALIVLLPASSVVKFAEQGFDDGPFYGEPFTGRIVAAAASDRLPYREGELLIYNRADAKAPILAYQIEDETAWAQVLDVSKNPRYANYEFTAMQEPSLAYGIFRDRLDFLGTWNFGTERGRAYFWKWGGFHRFFLSW